MWIRLLLSPNTSTSPLFGIDARTWETSTLPSFASFEAGGRRRPPSTRSTVYRPFSLVVSNTLFLCDLSPARWQHGKCVSLHRASTKATATTLLPTDGSSSSSTTVACGFCTQATRSWSSTTSLRSPTSPTSESDEANKIVSMYLRAIL